MANQLEPKQPRGITPAQRERFAKGQAKKAQVQIVTKDKAHVVNHVRMMAFVERENERGKISFTIREIVDGLNMNWSERGQVKTLLQELRYIGVVMRDEGTYKFLKRRWPVPAWSRFRLTDEVITSRKARVALSSDGRGYRKRSAFDTLHMPAFITRTDPRVLLVLAILAGMIILVILVSSPPSVITDNVVHNPFIALVVITPIIVFCIDAPLLTVKILHLHYLSWLDTRKATRSRRLVAREVLDASLVPAGSISGSKEEDVAKVSESPIPPIDREPLPPSAETSGVFGETTTMGDPIRALVAKLGHTGEPLHEQAAANINSAIFCSLVFGLHKGKTDDDASQLIAAIIPAGSIPNEHVITELAARSASRFRTVTGVDAKIEAEGMGSRPSLASTMRVYAEPYLLDYDTLFLPASAPGKWYDIPTSRLKGKAVELRPLASAVYKEPEHRERVDTKYVETISREKGMTRGYDKAKGGTGWRERDARGTVAASLFEDIARDKEAGIRPKPVEHDPGKLDITLIGFPTRLTNAAVSARLKRGVKVTLRCSACGAGPGDVDELGILDYESTREMERAFKAPIAALCPTCMDKHGIRVVEDTLSRDPEAVYKFLRDNDDLGERPWAFDELAGKLGALSDRAKRRLSDHLAFLEKELKVRPAEGGKYAFNRSGYAAVYEVPAIPPPCSECGATAEGSTAGRYPVRIRLRDDTAKVLARVRGAPVTGELCDACAARYGVVVSGYVRETIH